MTDWMQPQKSSANMNVSFGDKPSAQPGGGSANAAPLVADIGTAEFGPEVVEASHQQPVIVDFWAPWCGPCKQLGPILEKVVSEAGGAVRMVKMDIDQHPEVAGQMRIQSIPAVVAFVDGKPADAFMGAKPESEVRAFVDKLVAMSPNPGNAEPDFAAAVEQAKELFDAKDFGGAAETYAAVLQQEPGNLDAIAGLGHCFLAVEEVEKARGMVEQVPGEFRDQPPMSTFITALELAEQAESLGDIAPLQAAVEADPKNFDARFDYAIALNARGMREEATEQLLEIVRRDRKWRDDGARTQLLEFFEAWGNTDSATISGRRGLSSVLFS